MVTPTIFFYFFPNPSGSLIPKVNNNNNNNNNISLACRKTKLQGQVTKYKLNGRSATLPKFLEGIDLWVPTFYFLAMGVSHITKHRKMVVHTSAAGRAEAKGSRRTLVATSSNHVRLTLALSSDWFTVWAVRASRVARTVCKDSAYKPEVRFIQCT